MYYPKSQITPNLYTNGNEFVDLSTQQQYIGFYYKISTGKYFTGRNQDDKPNVELKLISPSDNNPLGLVSNTTTNFQYNITNIEYDSITQNKYRTPPITIPTFSPNPPTQQDYQNGEFRRLFCKKTNEIIYIEINQETYDKLVAKDPQILWQLYMPFNIPWQLTGDKNKVATTNSNIIQLTSLRNKLPKLNEYLKFDYLKYYK